MYLYCSVRAGEEAAVVRCREGVNTYFNPNQVLLVRFFNETPPLPPPPSSTSARGGVRSAAT